MNWLRRFMTGRYGADQLNLALVVLSLVLSIIFRFIPVPFLYLVTYIPLGFAVFRMLSRNIVKRGTENVKFLNLWYVIKRTVRREQRHMHDRKFYKFIKCPRCTQKIRLPKGRGKLRVTCPKCGAGFDQKT